MSGDVRFPAAFVWGAATAAHQIEGGNVNSDWWEREHDPAAGIREPSGDACDSYHRYPEDMRLLAEAGLSMYRFSVEWARIEPEDGFFSAAQLDHYRRMIATARDLGLEPMVTLHHFTHPRWFARAGGWRSPHAVDRFRRYVAAVSGILDEVEWVCTINEPNMVAMGAGQDGPDLAVAEALARAHRAARSALAEAHGTRVRSGWSVATQDFQALPGAEEVCERHGYHRDGWFLEAAAADDWVGVQAYTRTLVGPDGPLPVPPGAERTLTGWEYYPLALADGVRLARRHAPGVPVLVTENGIATADDARRIDYVRAALRGLAETMAEGSEVLGYLYWSLLDNYEWGSYEPTFGLVAVDHRTFERRPKPSLGWLGAVARAGRVPGEDEARP